MAVEPGGMGCVPLNCKNIDLVREKLANPNPERLLYIRYALLCGMTAAEISGISGIDEWFVSQAKELIDFEAELANKSLVAVPSAALLEAKRLGYSDSNLALILETDEKQVRVRRQVLGIRSSFVEIDSGVIYSTYEASEGALAVPSVDKKVVILCPGPNRIGQGAEFDCTCLAASRALVEDGWETIMVNCSPGAVSTDPQSSTRVYFEPVVLERVLDIIEREKPTGVIALLGGQTSVSLLEPLSKAGVNLLGTSPGGVRRAKDRKHFGEFVRKLGLREIDGAWAESAAEARECAEKLGYPLLARSFEEPLRLVEIIYDEADLDAFWPPRPNALKRPGQALCCFMNFLEDATEVAVDVVSDGETTLVCGVLEYIEQAGVHAADSACALPPHSLSEEVVAEIERQARLIAVELGIVGIVSVQFAVKDWGYLCLEREPLRIQDPAICEPGDRHRLGRGSRAGDGREQPRVAGPDPQGRARLHMREGNRSFRSRGSLG